MEGYLRKINLLPKNVNKLSVWDIDDTLFTSKDIRIFIVKNNQLVEELTTSEWNSYALRPGETPDFSQFRDGKFFFHSATPLSRNLRLAKNALESKDTMMITLSARSKTDNKNLFLKKFEMYGLDMNRATSHSVFAGSLGVKTSRAKALILDSCLKTNRFKSVHMYDDHKDNLVEFLKLETKYKKIEFTAYSVNSKGKIELFR
jgi:hypothetical protein